MARLIAVVANDDNRNCNYCRNCSCNYNYDYNYKYNCNYNYKYNCNYNYNSIKQEDSELRRTAFGGGIVNREYWGQWVRVYRA